MAGEDRFPVQEVEPGGPGVRGGSSLHVGVADEAVGFGRRHGAEMVF